MSSTNVPNSFFKQCAFVSVDFEEMKRGKPFANNEALPRDFREHGFQYDDINAADDFLWDVACPNALKVANACRKLRLPMIFVYWGYLQPDGMDLDPNTRKRMVYNWGENPKKWIHPHHISHPMAKPSSFFKIRKGEYTIAKTDLDAFPSSNISYVFKNLNAKNLILIGGHTGGCLGATSRSAKAAGYRTLCVEDASFDLRESMRIPNLMECRYDYVMKTGELQEKVRSLFSDQRR